MLARATQIFLVIFGLLLVLLVVVPLHYTSGQGGGGVYFAGAMFMKMVYILLGLLCFLGAYKIGSRRKKAK